MYGMYKSRCCKQLALFDHYTFTVEKSGLYVRYDYNDYICLYPIDGFDITHYNHKQIGLQQIHVMDLNPKS